MQMTLTPAFVEIRFELFALLAAVLNLGKMLPLRTERFWKAIGEMKGDELRQSRFVAMRQITALVPTAKALLGILDLRWRGPVTLALHQFAHAGIVRRAGTTGFGRLAHDRD